MLMFNPAISCLTMSNFPWFRDLTFQVPVQYCCLQHWTLVSPPDTSTTGCFQVGSASLFILSGAISPLFLSSILDTFWTRRLIFQCLIFLPFHTVHGVLKARILEWFAIPSSRNWHLQLLENDQVIHLKSGILAPLVMKFDFDQYWGWGQVWESDMIDTVVLVFQLCLTLCNPMDYSPPGSSAHGHSPGKNTGVGCHSLLQNNRYANKLNYPFHTFHTFLKDSICILFGWGNGRVCLWNCLFM